MDDAKVLNQGFSLVEVMIALAVISIGALGFTKAQISAIQIAEDAGLRTSASILAGDMVARMQANAGDVWQYLSSGYHTGPATFNANCLSSTGSICTGNEMALHDLYDWQNEITNTFPAWSGAFGQVCLDLSPGSTSQTCNPPLGTVKKTAVPKFTIKIFWKTWANRSTSTYDYVVTTVMPPLQR